jgi:hypothetical protein
MYKQRVHPGQQFPITGGTIMSDELKQAAEEAKAAEDAGQGRGQSQTF